MHYRITQKSSILVRIPSNDLGPGHSKVPIVRLPTSATSSPLVSSYPLAPIARRDTWSCPAGTLSPPANGRQPVQGSREPEIHWWTGWRKARYPNGRRVSYDIVLTLSLRPLLFIGRNANASLACHWVVFYGWDMFVFCCTIYLMDFTGFIVWLAC